MAKSNRPTAATLKHLYVEIGMSTTAIAELYGTNPTTIWKWLRQEGIQTRKAGNCKDLTGQTFGRLTVIKRSGIGNNGDAHWLCSCRLPGDERPHKEVVVNGYKLRKGRTQSCGCYGIESRCNNLVRGATRLLALLHQQSADYSAPNNPDDGEVSESPVSQV